MAGTAGRTELYDLGPKRTLHLGTQRGSGTFTQLPEIARHCLQLRMLEVH